MRIARIAALAPVFGFVIAAGGCSAAVPATSDTAAATDGEQTAAAELLRSTELAVQSDGAILVTSALDWEPEEVSDNVPTGERLHPSWSPDGTALAFSADAGDGTRDIWLADASSGRAAMLVDCAAPCVWADDPTWSPDGERIGFVRGETDASGQGIGTIRSVTADGGDEVLHFTAAPTEYPFAIDWSPGRESFAAELTRFASAEIADQEMTGSAIAIVGLDGRAEVITDYRDGLGYPSWSPDGARLLMSDADVWAMDLATRERQWLAGSRSGGGRALQAVYTPDGRCVVFVLERRLGATPMVSAIGADGGGILQLGAGTHPQVRP